MPSVNIKITDRMMDLVNNNVVSIHVDVFGSGNDVYGRVTQPHPGLGVFPNTSMNLADLESSLEKIKITQRVNIDLHSNPKTAILTRGEPVVGVGGEASVVRYGTHGRLGFRVPKELFLGDVWNLLPEDSLTFKELEMLDFDDIKARILAVAEKRTSARVWSSCLAQAGTREADLTSHWNKTDGYGRFSMLSTKKKTGTLPPKGLGPLMKKLERIQCPFRGGDHLPQNPTQASEDEEASDFENEGVDGINLM